MLRGATLGGITDDPETLRPGYAKDLLQRWIGAAELPSQNLAEVRREIAQACFIDVVLQRCRSFEDFAQRLRGGT